MIKYKLEDIKSAQTCQEGAGEQALSRFATMTAFPAVFAFVSPTPSWHRPPSGAATRRVALGRIALPV